VLTSFICVPVQTETQLSCIIR